MAERKSSHIGLLLIALFKLLKATLLLAVAVGAHHLLNRDVQETLIDWTQKIRADPDNRFIHALLSRITSLDERRLQAITLGTLLYGTLFAVEGVGLLMPERCP